MTSHITTHVLDTMRGGPAPGVVVVLSRHAGTTDGTDTADGTGTTRTRIATGTTDADGRCQDLGPQSLEPGTYRLEFDTGAYFAARQTPSFYPRVTIDFILEPGQDHYHVPILLSPFAYSTYRGS